jgi:prophage DNA circulation protein
MAISDLNNLGDFTRATMGNVGSVLQTLDLAGRDPEKWDILEASYNGVLFLIFQSKSDWQGALSQIEDIGGRRKIKYMFPYRDGQTTDDLGRKPESFQMDILLFGTNYLKGITALLAEFNKPQPGDLVHPVRGKIKVAVEDVQIIHTHEKRKAAELRVTFIEHNFTIGDIRQTEDSSIKGALSFALGFIAKIESAILQIQGRIKFSNSLKRQINDALNSYKHDYAKLLTDVNVSLNINGAADIPSILPVNQGGNINVDGTLVTNTFQTIAKSTVQSTNTQTPTSVSSLVKQVNQQREQVKSIISLIQSQGVNALDLHQEVLDIKQSAVAMQSALERGIKSSKAQVLDYITPRLMSVREVAYAQGISLDRIVDIIILNPDLDSANFVPQNTLIRVPIE